MSFVDKKYDRKFFMELWRNGLLGEAVCYAQRYVRDAPRFSGPHYSALNDIAVLQRLARKAHDSFFDYNRLVRRWNLSEFMSNPQVQALNSQLVNYCYRLGFEPDPAPLKDISGDDRRIVAYGKFDNSEPCLENLHRMLSGCIADYKSYLGAAAHPLLEWAPPAQKYWVFAAATRRAGYHYPHFHTNAWLVATYYLAVPRSEPEVVLKFGEHPNVPHAKAAHVATPRESDLYLFPAYFYHGTSAAKSEALRINLGIDIQPTEAISEPME